MRNRIIAGLVDALIVVETARQGGSIITAEFANNYNKDVFAVPGRLRDTYSQGCNHLIKIHKAALIESAEDIQVLWLNFYGNDSFGYIVTDNAGNLLDTVLEITVASVNDIPTALDDQAVALVGERFADISPEDQDRLIQSVMSEPIRGRRRQMLALVSERERQRRRFRISTLRQVRRIYQTSGVPWRRRGYDSWPGVPGDPRAYTRLGPDYA